MPGFNLQTCARPNILSLKPYRCARDDYKDDGTNVLLDANENAHGPGLSLEHGSKLINGHKSGVSQVEDTHLVLENLNRYPDPHQVELKQALCDLRNTKSTTRPLKPENLFVGVGSDEAIDALIRCFCAPARDKLLTCPPTYGMYAVSAQVNDVEVVHVPLDPDHEFALQPELINQKLSADPTIKMMYLCSPGNPTGAVISKDAVRKVLEHPTWNGVVVIDEAYIDFATEGSSFADMVTQWPNLVVMQTLSKAFGLAGIRCGAAFASPQIAQLLNNFKAPYNVSSITSQLAIRALQPQHLSVMRLYRERILQQRQKMVDELPRIPGIGSFRGGFDSNFLLVQVLDRPGGSPCNEMAMRVYEGMAERKQVVVRFRGKEPGCTGCLRITVGTEDEVTKLLRELRALLEELLSTSTANGSNGSAAAEEVREKKANAVVA